MRSPAETRDRALAAGTGRAGPRRRLTEAERIHLFQLAGQLVRDGPRIHDTPPDGLRCLVEQLSASPAAVYDVRWNPVTWNTMWSALLGDPLDRPERERNLVWRNITGLPVK